MNTYIYRTYSRNSYGPAALLFRAAVFPIVFLRWRQQSIFVFLFAGCVAAIVLYLTALYSSYEFGTKIRNDILLSADIKEQVLERELQFRSMDANLSVVHEELLQTMENVSSIVYIAPDRSVAVSPSAAFSP